MYGNIFTRVLRLAEYLLINPEMLSVYLRTSIKGKSPLEMGIPWLSYSAIEFLNKFIKPHHKIAEYGGGGSTIFFAKRANSVLCIESDPVWAAKLSKQFFKENISNVNLLVRPFDANNRQKFMTSDFLKAINKDRFDVILIDSYDVNHNLRLECFHFAENYINENGCIVIDDSYRYTQLRFRNNAKSWKEFRSIGPCSIGITTTDIYFY
jgi:hypothetical protein